MAPKPTHNLYEAYVAPALIRAKTLREEARSAAKREVPALRNKAECTKWYFKAIEPIRSHIQRQCNGLESYSVEARTNDLETALKAADTIDQAKRAVIESNVYAEHRESRELSESSFSKEQKAAENALWKAVRQNTRITLPQAPPTRQARDTKRSEGIDAKPRPKKQRSELTQAWLGRTVASIFLILVPITGAHAASDIVKEDHAKWIFFPVFIYAYFKRYGHLIVGGHPYYTSEKNADKVIHILVGFLLVGTVCTKLHLLSPEVTSLLAFLLASFLAELMHRV